MAENYNEEPYEFSKFENAYIKQFINIKANPSNTLNILNTESIKTTDANTHTCYNQTPTEKQGKKSISLRKRRVCSYTNIEFLGEQKTNLEAILSATSKS